MSLNVTKTNLIIFHSSSKKTDHSRLKFKLVGKPLTQNDTIKHFGVLLDDHLLWPKQKNHVTTKLNETIGILNELRSRASRKILKNTYHSLFSSHLSCGSQLWNWSNITFKTEPWEKFCFKKKQYSISQVYQELKILKCLDLLCLPNCHFKSLIEKNQGFKNSLVHLRHCKPKAKRLLDVTFVNTKIYGTQSVKYNCIKNWNNFKINFPHIVLYKCTIH